jgi:hypothetical protein
MTARLRARGSPGKRYAYDELAVQVWVHFRSCRWQLAVAPDEVVSFRPSLAMTSARDDPSRSLAAATTFGVEPAASW